MTCEIMFRVLLFPDRLVEQIHPAFKNYKEEDGGKPLRYTDTLFTEQERGVSIKAMPLTMLLPDLNGEQHFKERNSLMEKTLKGDDLTTKFRDAILALFKYLPLREKIISFYFPKNMNAKYNSPKLSLHCSQELRGEPP